jgi:hypothetical protein
VIDAMPRPRLPHLHRERTRHGAIVWYVRVGHGTRIRLRADYGTAEFRAEYDAAVSGKPAKDGKATAASASDPRSLRWLWDQYRKTGAWLALSPATQRQRANIMRHVLEPAGSQPFARITRKEVVAGRDRRAPTPAMARNFVMTLRGLFKWALDAEYVAIDPTHGVDAPKPKTEGFHAWTMPDPAPSAARIG